MMVFVVGSIVEWLRLSSADQGTLWAEDVRNFLGNAVTHGIASLVTPYAGYLHTVPRLIATGTVAVAPVAGWATSMAFGACVVAAGVAALVFICARDVVPSTVLRLGLAAITLLVPLAPREVLGNTANLHWYFLWLAPWLLLYRPRTRTGAWLLAGAALLATMTEIQMAVFIPLMLWRWRDRPMLPVRMLYLVGVAAQLLATLSDPRGSSSANPVPIASVAYGYLINAVMTSWTADPHVIAWMLGVAGPIAGIVLLLPFAAAAVVGLLRGSRLQRLMVVVCSVSSMAFYAIAVEVSPGTFYDYASMSDAQLDAPWLARYGVAPSMFLLALVPLALAALARPRGVVGESVGGVAGTRVGIGAGTAGAAGFSSVGARPRKVLLPAITLVVLAAVLAGNFSSTVSRRSNGPLWQPQVAAMEAYCDIAAPSAVYTLRGAPAVEWKVDVPCSRVP